MTEKEMEKGLSSAAQQSVAVTVTKDRISHDKKKEGLRGAVSSTSNAERVRATGKGFQGKKYGSQRGVCAFEKKSKDRYHQNGRALEDMIDQVSQKHVKGKRSDITHLINFEYRSTSYENPYAAGYSESGRTRARRCGGNNAHQKSQYLHANCQFVVRENKSYVEHNIDPDKLIDWDNIEQVRMMSTEMTCCPICLHPPTAAKITKCGHHYCSSCILHFIALEETSLVNCPVCKAPTGKAQLKSVQAIAKSKVNVHDQLTLRLMKREKGTVYTMPLQEWTQRNGIPHAIDDEVSTCYSKVLTASPEYIRNEIIDPERRDLVAQLEKAEETEICFIEQALELLKKREEKLDQDSPRSSFSESGFVEQMPAETTETRSRTISSADSHTSDSVLLSTSETSGSFGDYSESSCNDEQLFNASALTLQPQNDKPASDERDAAVFAVVAAQHLDLPPDVHESEDNSKRKNARAPSRLPPANSFFYYYQAEDGQHIYLDSINSRCLAEQYGSLVKAPLKITAKIEAIEVFAMTEELRKRQRYLNHIPLSCQFRVAELKLDPPLVSKETLARFKKQIDARRQGRQRRQRMERQHNRKVELVMNRLMGKFPDMGCSVESTQHFPSMQAGVPEPTSSSEEVQGALHEYVLEDVDIEAENSEDFPISEVAASHEKKTESNTPSYSQMLKHAAVATSRPLPRAPTWPALASKPHVQEEVSDEEGPRPGSYQQSYAQDLLALSQTPATSEQVESPATGKKRKGKKKEKRLLFSTEMRASRH